jgi:hypothetical protein
MNAILSRCLPAGLVLLAAIALPPLVSPVSGEEDADALAAAEAMTARVDELLVERWSAEGVTPAPQAGDAELLRRAFLDLNGTIPKAAEVLAFLHDERPDKRARLIDELLSRPAHATHLANIWRGMLLPGDADVQAAGGAAGFHAWLRDQFTRNVRYDNVVADLLVARGSGRQVGPALFYTALDLKPEEVAASTSRIFLGVQIQCAQCHDHPTDGWKQADFWGYAAFFARIQQRQGQRADLLQVVDADSGEVTLPGTETVIAPKYLDAPLAREGEDESRRRQLAIWLVSRNNPFFARASVNRAWSVLFGRGLVDPVDDMSERNPPSHPELLAELAEYFTESGCDLRMLFRVLANTKVYQLSSENPGGDEPPPELYARMAIKSLSPDQLFDSLAEATRRREAANAARRAGGGLDAARMEFTARFQAPGQAATEFQAGIPQALTMINGRAIAEAADPAASPLLAALEAPFLSDADRVDALFLSTLSRPPSDEERSRFTEYVAAGGPAGDRRKALGDALWALVNSAEFVLNH